MTFYDIFVYGTLRHGGMYAHHLTTSELIREKYHLSGFALYDYIQWYPYMIAEAGSEVIGDVYRVSKSVLPVLHELEGVDEHLFRFEYLDKEGFYTYLKFDNDVSGLTRVNGGDWLSYYQSLKLEE